jgi:Cellulose binding domain
MDVPFNTVRPCSAVLALVVGAGAMMVAAGACQGPAAFYRHAATDGGSAGRGGAGDAPGRAGSTGLLGVAGASAPCTTCMVKVQYTCRSEDTRQASFVLNVLNNASTPIALADLTLRYWYTMDADKEQELNCDYAKLGCTNLITSASQPPLPAPKFQAVMPPKPGANEYVELAFTPGALSLEAFLDTGEMQLSLHNKEPSDINQTDDYSFNCSLQGNAIEWVKITAYVKGVLVWGAEPQ